jgi:2-keto-3-deoxy-L-rhamnonate aldolase RhmA
VGPYDLSASYGIAGQLDHPLVREAHTRILEATKQAGAVAGIHVVHPPVHQVKARLDEGFRFIAYGADMLFLGQQCRDAMAELRSLGA